MSGQPESRKPVFKERRRGRDRRAGTGAAPAIPPVPDLKAVLDALPAGVLLSDAQGNLVYANQEAERLWGHAFIRTGIEGYGRYQLFDEEGNPSSPDQTLIAQVVRTGAERLSRVSMLRNPEGSDRFVLSIGSPVRGADGSLEAAVVVFTDISEMKRLERRQQRLMEIAQAVNGGIPLDSVLRLVRDAAVETGEFDRVGIWLYDEAAGGMRGSWGTDRQGNPVDEHGEFYTLTPDGPHPMQQLLAGRIPFLLRDQYDMDPHPSAGVDMTGVGSHAVLPLRSRGRVIGNISTDNLLSGRPIHATDLKALLPFCEQAALAIESARLREAEREKAERLEQAMRETHHRVKNNLQVIASLLDLQLMTSEGPIDREEMHRVMSQVHAITAVHDFLSQGKPGQDVSARQLLEKLLPMLRRSGGIRCSVDVADCRLTVKQGTALALAVSELVNNAMKHGASAACVSLSVTDGSFRLTIEDDGPGFPPGFDLRRDAHLGLGLVTALVERDLQGAIRFANRAEGGARVTADFRSG